MVPAGFSRSSLKRRKLGVDLLKPGTQGVQQAFARLGRRDAARGAGQQPKTEPFLESADGVAERRLRNAELRCRPGETALLRDREEGDEIIEVFAAAFMSRITSVRILASNRIPFGVAHRNVTPLFRVRERLHIWSSVAFMSLIKCYGSGRVVPC